MCYNALSFEGNDMRKASGSVADGFVVATTVYEVDDMSGFLKSYETISENYSSCAPIRIDSSASKPLFYFENMAAYKQFNEITKKLIMKEPSNMFLLEAYSLEQTKSSLSTTLLARESLAREAQEFFDKILRSGCGAPDAHTGAAGTSIKVARGGGGECEDDEMVELCDDIDDSNDLIGGINIVLESHTDLAAKTFVIANIAKLVEENYVFVAEDISDEYQANLTAAVKSRNFDMVRDIIPLCKVQSDFPDMRSYHLNRAVTTRMFELLVTNGVPIIAGDSSLSMVGDGSREQRLLLGNYSMVSKCLEVLEGGPILLFAGAAHGSGKYPLGGMFDALGLANKSFIVDDKIAANRGVLDAYVSDIVGAKTHITIRKELSERDFLNGFSKAEQELYRREMSKFSCDKGAKK